jgi:hypothetical protein
MRHSNLFPSQRRVPSGTVVPIWSMPWDIAALVTRHAMPWGQSDDAQAYMQGAVVDGWQAPALTALNPAPVPWSEEEFFRYLRQGHTQHHGVAAGPMGLVVRNLAQVPNEDIRAMAVYLASLQPAAALHETTA